MSIYAKYADAPNQIKSEGQNITVRFKRNGDGTATVFWNIPAPAAGCAVGSGVYDGIVITLDEKPANYISTSPKDKTYYNADNTSDRNLHSGDVIDTALVVGAFYHDTVTSSLILTDIKERTPYYISAYAVDNVGRYHREGVHAYSLPTGSQEGGTPDTVAEHTIQLDPRGGIDLYDITGLDPSTDHGFEIEINRKMYDINLRGVDVATYEDLINAINLRFARIENPYEASTPLNTDGLYFDIENRRLLQWNGGSYDEINFITSTYDLNLDLLGAFVFNPLTKSLGQVETGGVILPISFIMHPTDPTAVQCGTVWVRASDMSAYRFNGTTFCPIELINSIRNPLLTPLLSCDDYWFNTESSTMGKWDKTTRMWKSVEFIYANVDPTYLPDGYFWFNDDTSELKVRLDGSWDDVTFLNAESTDDGAYPNPLFQPIDGQIWFDSRLSEFFIFTDDEWMSIRDTLIIFNRDPSNVIACDHYWNYATGGGLFIRNIENTEWVRITNFTSSGPDPALPRIFEGDVVWYKSDTNEYKLITGQTCKNVDIIVSEFDPTRLPNGTLWYDGNDLYFRVNGTWISTPFIKTTLSPLIFIDGMFWFNPNERSLYRYSSSSGWLAAIYSDRDISPNVGDLWLSTVDSVLRMWDGNDWKVRMPLVEAEFIKYGNSRERSRIRFYTRDVGCKYGIEVIRAQQNLFANLQNNVIYDRPIRGNSGKVAGPLYKQLGVGDDGSPDERRELHSYILNALGNITVQVELTKDQIDRCIDNALAMLRKYSSYSVKRGMFFLDLFPNQQTYVMTNQCVGFNKIVSINGVFRMRGGFFKSTFAGSDLFFYGALQQLYSVATFDMLSFHLVSSYMEELETLFATRILYQFYELDRELKIYQTVIRPERVLVDAYMERTEQELMTDRQTHMWIKGWALAEAKLTLSQIRGKFTTLPGPNGSTTLNSQELITQGETEKQELMALLEDMSMQDINNVGLQSHLIIG